MTFYNQLKLLVEKSHKSFNQVERELGYPRNALANYRLGKEPSAKRLAEIANYFDVPLEYLLCENEMQNYKKIQFLFNHLTQTQKKQMLDYIQTQLKGQKQF